MYSLWGRSGYGFVYVVSLYIGSFIRCLFVGFLEFSLDQLIIVVGQSGFGV